MTRSIPRPGIRRSLPAALFAGILAAGILPGPGLAGTSADTASADTAPVDALPADALAGDGQPASAAGPGVGQGVPATPATSGPPSSLPSTAYEEWLVHEHDQIRFQPGGRVTIGFTPRSGDGWTVGGRAPTSLPAGRETGVAMAAERQAPEHAPTTSGGGADALGGAADPGSPAPVDAPAGIPLLRATPASFGLPAADASPAPDAASSLRRQVFGFLPYWQLSGAASSLNYSVLTTIAYFSVGADSAGNLKKRNSNGSLTTGWAGWTSSSLTSVINAAHSHGTRVVLTASVFAWTTSAARAQKALLGSAAARSRLASQLVAAVRNRGADGVNLDFEPLVSGQEANFVAFLRTLRAKFNAVHAGYQITYDTTGYIGNYPLEASVGPSAADAVFIMGYDYRTAGSSRSGSIDPLSGPGYDLADTIREYTARISPSRVILGVPWYGRAWSTSSSSPRSSNISGAKYGYSTAVDYANIPALVAKYGRHWDSVEQSPYIVYKRRNCTSAYGCVTSWRQVWYEDTTSLGLRYQLVNDYRLRGAGVWALGYDGGYQGMVRALSSAFLVDHAAPQAGIKALPAQAPDEGIVVSWSAADVSTVRTYSVQVSTDGGPWTTWLGATKATSNVWLGADGHAYAFRVRATDSKGNVGSWNVTTKAAAAPAKLAVGGFGRVTLNGLAYRTGPDTSAAKLGSLRSGTIVALTSGPVSADGYTWYEVTQPVKEWAPVSFAERGVWIAVRTSSSTFVVPYHAPSATVVNAGITGLDFGNGGSTGSAASAVAARSFSPNHDGSQDSLRVRWTATVALTSLTLNVLRLDGKLVGSVAVPVLAAGAHSWAWDGKVAGKRVSDGRYLLQLVGRVGTKTYHAPSAKPASSAQIAAFAVTVDTVRPVVTSASASTNLISPNGDGMRESATFALASTGATRWLLRVALGGADPVRTISGSGGKIKTAWNGRSDAGAVVADGRYTVTLAACDVAGNCATRSYSVRVDTTPPAVTLAAPTLFSPNGDGTADSARLAWTSSEKASGTASIWKGTTLVRRWAIRTATGGSIAWNGRTGAGAALADGRYAFKVDVRDAAGNRTTASARVTIDRTLGWLRWSGNFYPQDGDKLAATATLNWKQTRAATTTLAIYDAHGQPVRTIWSKRTLAAGSHTWHWTGRLADGSYAPQGAYTARLTVVSPYGTQTLTRKVWAAAFPATLSAKRLKPGQTLTVTFASSEPLKTAPKVRFHQPGLTSVTVTATKLADGRFRAEFTVRRGTAGTASLRITATDSGGHTNSALFGLTMGG